MELGKIWQWYYEQRLPEDAPLPSLMPVTPWQAIGHFFDAMPLFTGRIGAIRSTAYNTAFDDEADGALASLAINDSFAEWDMLSAGAWRVLYERLVYAMVVAAANEAQGNPVIARHPEGFDRQTRSRALLLEFLLGGARTIDPRLLEKHGREGLPDPAALRPIRKQ